RCQKPAKLVLLRNQHQRVPLGSGQEVGTRILLTPVIIRQGDVLRTCSFNSVGGCMRATAVARRLSVGTAVLFFTSVAFGKELPVKSLLDNPAQFDGTSVTVRGTTLAVKETVSRIGNAYTTFQVQDAGAVITVFTWGHPGTRDANRVEVTGIFQRVRHVGRYTFYNEIEAKNIRRLAR